MLAMDDPYTTLVNHFVLHAKCKRGYIPIQRNRHGTEPRTHPGSKSSTPHSISGSSHAPDFSPSAGVDSVDVDQGCGRENGHVRCAEDGFEVVGGKRGAKENE